MEFAHRWAAQTFKLDGSGWSDQVRIMQLDWGLRSIPPKPRNLLRDVTFVYTGLPAGTNEDGHWDSATKTLSLYFKATGNPFDRGANRVGTEPYYVWVIAHEIGHALEMMFDTAALAPFKTAIADDGGSAITDYGVKNADESFGKAFAAWVTDRHEFTALRAKTAAFFTGRYG